MNYNDVIAKEIVLHKVGNKNEEFCSLSKKPLSVDDDVRALLTTYFLSAFKSPELFNLFHDSDIELNEVYSYVSKVFEDSSLLFEQSINLAKHLYENSTHPKIKSGEFYVVYFNDCVINGETVDAIGLFKSENKDTFLKVYQQGDGFEVESQEGININKLDKGCLIFNIDKENGYLVSVVDNTNKGAEAQYWINDFLHVSRRKDEYYNTQNILTLCKDFVTQELPREFEISKADQADILNKSVKFFKEKETFDINQFTNEVLEQSQVIDSFNNFKKEYQEGFDIEIADNFAISESAVKKQARIFKSVIKLDKNFHIYVHGNNQYIKKGYDESTGMNYYQLFFKEEE
ncbi:MAG: hypothetical protein H6Q15_254 [Bacteroidetes bacterium]|nr:hypothetical protein [Bacteroidota bacterium]